MTGNWLTAMFRATLLNRPCCCISHTHHQLQTQFVVWPANGRLFVVNSSSCCCCCWCGCCGMDGHNWIVKGSQVSPHETNKCLCAQQMSVQPHISMFVHVWRWLGQTQVSLAGFIWICMASQFVVWSTNKPLATDHWPLATQPASNNQQLTTNNLRLVTWSSSAAKQ